MKLTEQNSNDFRMNSKPKCPHCGSDYDIEDNEAHELYAEGDYDIECLECEYEFTVSVHATFYYSTDEQGL